MKRVLEWEYDLMAGNNLSTVINSIKERVFRNQERVKDMDFVDIKNCAFYKDFRSIKKYLNSDVIFGDEEYDCTTYTRIDKNKNPLEIYEMLSKWKAKQNLRTVIRNTEKRIALKAFIRCF